MSAKFRSSNSTWIALGSCLVDLDSGVVQTDQGQGRLTHQAIEVLKALLAAAPEVCSREQLVDSVWRGNYLVGNRTIPSVIYTLRRALNDDDKPGLIRTVPRVGYRLASVPMPCTTRTTAPARHRRRWWIGAAAAVLTALALYAALGPEIRIRVQRQAYALPLQQPDPAISPRSGQSVRRSRPDDGTAVPQPPPSSPRSEPRAAAASTPHRWATPSES